MRYKYVYMVFPRAYSKSFLSVMVLMIRCILYPGAKLFVTSGGKEQAASIIKEKVAEICTLVPAFDREIDRRRGKTQESKDYCYYIFKNGSYFDNVAAKESSRGKRRHGGLIEECVGVDGDILNQVLIPLMNIDRRCLDGTVHEEETLNKSQIFVSNSDTIERSIEEKPAELLGSPERVISSEASSKRNVQRLSRKRVHNKLLVVEAAGVPLGRRYSLIYIGICSCESA